MLTIVDLIDFIDREIEQAKSSIENATTEQWRDKNEGVVSALKAVRNFINLQSIVGSGGIVTGPELTEPARFHGLPKNCS